MKRLLTGVAVIFSVHAITSFLVTFLPNAASVALGILGGNDASIANYWESRDHVGYFDRSMQLMHADLGQTLDNTSVVNELTMALAQTGPSLVIALCLAFLSAFWVLKARSAMREHIGTISDTLSLLPPFIVPFIIAPVLFLTPFAGSSIATQTAVVVSITLPLAIMITAMLIRFYHETLNEKFFNKLALNGLSLSALHRISRLNAWFRILAVFDRIVVAGLVGILLAEPLFGVSGIGTLTARAIRTSDPNLTVAISTAIASVVIIAGLFGTVLRPLSSILMSQQSRAPLTKRAKLSQ
ncbi:hypothetical protein [Parasphingorhabdus sp.]|uniref:hypothetical protein n=1 Tax=Parasphingorhabdus sp. TaxID=2709688 RepID=UPI0035936E65